MGNMNKKRNLRVHHLENEYSQLLSLPGKLTTRQQRRAQRIRDVELPKAKRNAARMP